MSFERRRDRGAKDPRDLGERVVASHTGDRAPSHRHAGQVGDQGSRLPFHTACDVAGEPKRPPDLVARERTFAQSLGRRVEPLVHVHLPSSRALVFEETPGVG